jgi:hypothetical protein
MIDKKLPAAIPARGGKSRKKRPWDGPIAGPGDAWQL